MRLKRFGFEMEKFDKTTTGFCAKCRKEFPLADLKTIMVNPHEKMYICQKCDWKRRVKRTLHM